jgi:DNA-binding LacI/PurR family transcriptional regulator
VPAAIHQRGLRGPQDVARVGFDGRPSAEALDPPLTVVRPPAYEVGRQARELLLKRIIEPAPVPVRLRPALVACLSKWRLARQAADKRQNA